MACCGKSTLPSIPAPRAAGSLASTIRVRVENDTEELAMRKQYEGWTVQRQAIGPSAALLIFRR